MLDEKIILCDPDVQVKIWLNFTQFVLAQSFSRKSLLEVRSVNLEVKSETVKYLAFWVRAVYSEGVCTLQPLPSPALHSC